MCNMTNHTASPTMKRIPKNRGQQIAAREIVKMHN